MMENLLYRDRPHFHFQAPVGYPSRAGRKPLEARCVSFFRIPPSGLILYMTGLIQRHAATGRGNCA